MRSGSGCGGRGSDRGVEGVQIGQVPLEASGDDLTWLVIETPEELSRSRVLSWLEKAGLKARMRAMHSPKSFAASFYLVEVDGYLAEDGVALEQVQAAAGKALARMSHIGVVARPIAVEGV